MEGSSKEESFMPQEVELTMREWNLKGRIVKKGQKGNGDGAYTTFYFSQTIKAKNSAEFFLKKNAENGNRKDPIHKNSDSKASSTEKLQLTLFKKGGVYITTKSQKWIFGCRFSNKNFMELFLLFRKGGVDVKIYSSSAECLEKSVFDLVDGRPKFWVDENKYCFNHGAVCSLNFENPSNYAVYGIVHRLIYLFQGVTQVEEVEQAVSHLKEKCLFSGHRQQGIEGAGSKRQPARY